MNRPMNQGIGRDVPRQGDLLGRVVAPRRGVPHRRNPVPFRSVRRRGISLLEVLISIFVLSIGLLGVLAIIPLGQLTISEAVKSDRAGACGRAAMRQIKVQRMLDYRWWYWEENLWGRGYDANNNLVQIKEPDAPVAGYPYGMVVFNTVNPPREAIGSFMIDPLGRAKELPSILYGIAGNPNVFLPRRTLGRFPLNGAAGRNPTTDLIDGNSFYWPDDIGFEIPPNSIERPRLPPSVTLDDMRSLDYSYLFTVSPASSEREMAIPMRRLFEVTVAVFFKRNFNLTLNADPLKRFPEGEWMADVRSVDSQGSPDHGFPGLGVGGGTVRLDAKNVNGQWMLSAYHFAGNAGSPTQVDYSESRSNIRENQWVMLWDSANGNLAWYRVVGVALDIDPTVNPTLDGNEYNFPTLMLNGPDWTPSATTKLIVIDGAIGAYTTIIELDYDPLWGGM